MSIVLFRYVSRHTGTDASAYEKALWFHSHKRETMGPSLYSHDQVMWGSTLAKPRTSVVEEDAHAL